VPPATTPLVFNPESGPSDCSVRPILPIELWEKIFSCYTRGRDKVHLKNVGLVSRQWRLLSLRFLLCDISLADEWDFQALKRLLDQHPHLVGFIQKVYYNPTRDDLKDLKYDEAEKKFSGGDNITYTTVPPSVRLPRLPNVTTLKWYTTLKGCVAAGPATALFLSSLPALTELMITCKFADVYAIEEFIHACGPNLETIRLVEIDVEDNGDMLRDRWGGYQWGVAVPSAPFSLGKLQKVVINDMRVEPHWLQTRLLRHPTFGPPSLTCLHVQGDCFEPKTLGSLLDFLSSSLQELQLEPPNREDG
jgi:hypothetical protein